MSTMTLGDALFTKTQQRVLALLYERPRDSFYTNEIVRWANMGRGTIRRESDRLIAAELIQVSRRGNQHYYQANPSSPIFAELVGLVRKTFGLVDVMRTVLEPLGDQIDLAVIYGSIAKQEDTSTSDLDLLVVSESLAYADLMTVLAEAESLLARPINPTIYTKTQIISKVKNKNAFLTKVFKQAKLWIKGGEDGIKEFGQFGKS